MKQKILIVEDDEKLVQTLKIRLEAAGFDPMVAYDGDEALEKVKHERPDLIVLDIMLPRVSGYLVCSNLKGDPKYKLIPIIMLTALDQESDQKQGEAVGADAYITKPFHMQDLVNRIKGMLEKQKKAA